MRVVIAIDLGVKPVLVAVTGTDKCPVLLAIHQCERWDERGGSEQVIAAIDDLKRIWPDAELCGEKTFSGGTRRKPWLRDVGRLQEAQAQFLGGWYHEPLERVEPCIEVEGFVAWQVLGSPEAGRGRKGEHVRDGCAVALKRLIERAQRSKGR